MSLDYHKAPSLATRSARSAHSETYDAGVFSSHESRLTLDIHIEEGFDVPLITQSQRFRIPSRTPSHVSQAGSGDINDTLINREPDTALDARSKSLDNHSAPERSARQRKSLLKGWRVGVFAAACIMAGTFLINLVATICASVEFDLEEGIGDVYVGSCDVVDRWSLGLHLLVNGLSTAIFSASNYTMQCLVAPKRKECDVAHVRGDWLDIGVPSVRNLFRKSHPYETPHCLGSVSSQQYTNPFPLQLRYLQGAFRQFWHPR